MAFQDWRVEIVSRDTDVAVNYRPATSQEHAAELEPDAAAHRAPAQGRRPARPRVARGHDLRELGAGALEVGLAGDHVAHEVVDPGEVLVVDLALGDRPQLHDRWFVGSLLDAHRQ